VAAGDPDELAIATAASALLPASLDTVIVLQGQARRLGVLGCAVCGIAEATRRVPSNKMAENGSGSEQRRG